MDNTRTEEIRDRLMKEDQSFRELAQQHQVFEKRLDEISELAYPNDDELLEEATLKKKKLVIKDQMHSIMNKYESLH